MRQPTGFSILSVLLTNGNHLLPADGIGGTDADVVEEAVLLVVVVIEDPDGFLLLNLFMG